MLSSCLAKQSTVQAWGMCSYVLTLAQSTFICSQHCCDVVGAVKLTASHLLHRQLQLGVDLPPSRKQSYFVTAMNADKQHLGQRLAH